MTDNIISSIHSGFETFNKTRFENKEINWNIINPVDHMNAPEDVSSTDKSLRFADNITDKNDLSSPENEKNQKKSDLGIEFLRQQLNDFDLGIDF